MKANVKKKLFPNGKKTFLYLTALLALSSFFLFLPGCAKVDAGLNLLANANFTNHTDFKEVSYAYTDEKGVEHNDGEAYNAAFVENKEFSGAYWSKQLPKDWTVRVSDEKVASFKGFDRDPKYKANSTDLDPEQSRNYAVLKINAAAIQSSGKNTGYGWIQLSQKIRVNPDSYYRITFQYKGAMSVPDASTGRNESYAKLFAGAAEDPSFIPAAARTVSISATTAQTYTLDVGSGNLRALTLTINVGAPGHEMGDSEVKVSGVSIYELAEKPDSNPHVLYKNGGFHATAFKAALWIAGGFIVFAVLCWFAVHFLTLNFVYHKPQEKIDGAPIGGGRGKGGPAKGGPNKGKAAVKSPPKFVKSVKKGPKSADLSADDGGDTLEVPFPNGEEEPAADTVSAAPVKTTSRADAIRAALAAKEAAMQSNPDRAAFGFGGGIEQPARDGKPRAEAADDAYKLDEEKAAAKRAAEEKAAAERAAAREAAGQAAAERAEAKASAKAAKAAQKAERKAAKAAAKETAAQAKAIEKQAKETAEREERAAAQAKAAAEREEKAAAQEKETAEKLEAALAEIEAAAEPEPAAAETPVEFEPEPVAVEPEPIAVEPEPVAEIEIKSFEPEPAAVEPEPVAEIEVKPFEPEPAADAFNGQKPVLNPAELTPDMFDVLKPVAEPDEPAAGTFDGVKPVVKYTEPVADTFDDVKPAAEPDGPAADIADEPAAERPEQPAPAAEPGKTFKQAVGETVSFVWKNYTVWVLLGLA
ncbi:MAG: hypothetical protein LBL66_10795, partial [Clostridiales bacterium]|nr:hypothetical protein [Clostridiales bacterium]